MADPRVSTLASARTFKTDPRAPQVHGSNGEGRRRGDAPPDPGEQAQAIRNQLPPAILQGYAAGGFDGVANSVPDWHNLPEWQRTQILAAVREGGR